MTEEQILQAFEGRWRIKSECLEGMPMYTEYIINGVCTSLIDHIRHFCLDFFRTGILLADGFQVAETLDEQGKPTGQMVIYKHEPILDTADKGFSEWWEMYGKKIDRGKCEKKWQKLTDEERRACIAATPSYVASTPDLQFRRHPATYLNNKSWENQIIPRNGTDKPTIEQQRIDKLADILTK